MEVRPTSIEDAAAIAAILAIVAEEGLVGTEPPVDVAQRAERFCVMLESGAISFVLVDGGQVVGSASAYDAGPRGVLELGMAILPLARGKGGGRMLLDAVVAQSRERCAHKIDLEVWNDNGRAIALYVAAGFAVQGVKRDHYRRRDGSLKSALMMTLRLDDA
jgi:ribosomal protein S18 acetylase RimI-like enzyme